MRQLRWTLALALGLWWSGAWGAGSIEVTGTGSAWASPDQVRVELGWSGVGREVRDAIAAADMAVSAIRVALLANGVAPEDVRTLNYYLWREERWDEGGMPQLVGYRLTHTLQVTLRTVAALGSVIDAASEAGANQIGGVSFHISARAELERSARAQAFETAHARAHELASLAGLTLGAATRIVERSPTDPFVGARSYSATAAEGGGGGFAPGEQAIEVSLEITFETHAAAAGGPRATP
jgi:uncharacterized protein